MLHNIFSCNRKKLTDFQIIHLWKPTKITIKNRKLKRTEGKEETKKEEKKKLPHLFNKIKYRS